MPEKKTTNSNLHDGAPVYMKEAEKAQVNSNIRITCFSVAELKDITISSNYDFVTLEYNLRAPDGKNVIEGTVELADKKTRSVRLDDILPLDEMKKYEKNEPPFYFLNTRSTLDNGQTLEGAFSFAGSLLAGKEATEMPKFDLKARLDAIPIATPDMTVDQLRRICVDFINLQTEFPYMLEEDVDQFITSQKKARKLRAGILHAGIPYISIGSGNVYRVAEFYNAETGTIDKNADILKTDRFFGNACSGSAYMAWSRVINSTKRAYTYEMTEAFGFIPVGPYKYDTSVEVFVPYQKDPDGYCCRTVCNDNGEQTMFESYAAMKLADGTTNNGHVRLLTGEPFVVRNPDGTINGDESYLIMSEQTCYTTRPNHVRIDKNGDHYIAQGGVNVKFTFKALFDTYYIPFTFAEFLGTKKVDVATVGVDSDEKLFSADDIAALTLTSNYPISDVFVTVKNNLGEKVYSCVHRSLDFFIKEMKLGEILPTDELKPFADHTISIDCQLFNGSKLNALSAKLKN